MTIARTSHATRTTPRPIVRAAVLALLGLATLAPTSPAVTATTAAAAISAAPPTAAVPRLEAEVVRTYDAFDANQGVGVGRSDFYAVNNQTVTRHRRDTGAPVRQFVGDADGPIEHLDSAAVVGRRLYAAHSNYPEWPMESSIEIYDARSLRHVGTHSFGIFRGSLTWLDRHDGHWWAAFANYDRVQEGQTEPYGETYNTQVVKLNDDFEVLEGWTIPKEILDRFEEMSNSGGSWGPDGRLWLTGHDLPEAYVMNLPESGGELEWVATVGLPGIEGQGIAWDRSGRRPTLWGISRDNAQVLRFDVPVDEIVDPRRPSWSLRGPGGFVR